MKDNIELKSFDLDEDIVATSIYGDEERKFTNEGLEISENIKREFGQFLEEFTSFTGLQRTAFFRIDAYFDKEKMYILDVNASFVDGWGNALNLTRAIKIDIDNVLLGQFPKNLYLQDEIYRPEFQLFINELNIQGKETQETDKIDEKNKTYMYGEYQRKANLFPYDGLRMDNKMNLALFSKQWDGNNIEIPEFILSSEASWEDIPKDYVFKISGKEDIGKNGWKVNIGKPKNGKVGAKLWEENKLVAQKTVDPFVDANGRNNQAIIMTIENEPVVGYVQKSMNEIINDNSLQGPLAFKQDSF